MLVKNVELEPKDLGPPELWQNSKGDVDCEIMSFPSTVRTYKLEAKIVPKSEVAIT